MKNQPISLLDGATGTMYFQAGLPVGEYPEMLNLTHPEAVTDVHRAYIAAGAQVVYANTFGANGIKMAKAPASIETVIAAAIANAKRATAGTAVQVALDIGPIGKLLAPYGDLPFAQAVDTFAQMMRAGQAAGADLIVLETMADLYEVKAALLAAREHTTLPVFVTMTFEANGRTYTGTSVEAFAAFATAWGVDALGVNCSLGPVELLPVVQRLAKSTNLPLIVKANAGLPNADGTYNFPAAPFAQAMAQYIELGVQWLGGCCGTSPAHIAALREMADGRTAQDRTLALPTTLCTASQVVVVDDVTPIGEGINPTNKPDLTEALEEGDMDVVQDYALDQQDAGAKLLDINVGIPDGDEPALMVQVVEAVQAVSNLPLVLDSLNPQAIEAGLRTANGKCIVNSVKATEESLSAILPLVKKYGAAVIGLTIDEQGIPQTAAQRLAIAQRIVQAAEQHGIAKQDVIIDCLVLGAAYQPDQTAQTLEAVALVREQLQVCCTLGISNISHGFADREARNAAFLEQAMAAGVQLPIVNVMQEQVQDLVG